MLQTSSPGLSKLSPGGPGVNWFVNWLLVFLNNFRDRVQDESFNLTSGSARFKWLLNSKQKASVLPVHSVSEFTHSFSFTPSSELYEWTNAGNSKWGYGGAISDTALGHVQVHTGAQRFATVSGLNDMFPGNGVQQGLRISNWDVKNVSQSAATWI